MKNIETETGHMNVVIRSRQQWDGTEVTYHRGNGVYSGSSFSTNLSEMQDLNKIRPGRF